MPPHPALISGSVMEISWIFLTRVRAYRGATIGIPGGLPLPDARLCGIGGEAQLVKELIHIAVHIR